MSYRTGLVAMILFSWAVPVLAWQAPKAAERYQPTEAERAEIEAKAAELAGSLEGLRAKVGDGPGGRDAISDVEVCLIAARRPLKHGDFFEAKDVARTLKALSIGMERAKTLAEGHTPWAEATGSTVRGYRSRVDGSVQPYAVIVPAGHAPNDRLRLDVVLHGRDSKISEARFFDAREGKPGPDDLPGLVLHVFGRGNNAYRWAGETDVFEAIDAVRRNYRVDDRKVVLRGFSMGGAGAWHLGLHHPSRWSSVEAGAGFTETINYAKLRDPSEVVRKGLRIYDAVDYARNAFDVPMVGYGGENDPQAQASKNIEEALVALGVPMKTEGLVTKAEGIDFLRIIGKGMGHAVDKESTQLMRTFHDEHIPDGPPSLAPKIRFVTYTLKYNRVGWVTLHRLIEHYRPATIEANREGEVATVQTENIAVIAIDRQAGDTLRLDGQEFLLREAIGELLPDVYFQKTDKGWEVLDHDQSLAVQTNEKREKHPGLQGPIDDAFAAPFLVVLGTGKPHHPEVQAWANARLERFADDWSRFMRGELRIKDDVDVTDLDIEDHHLILFGDPGSNRLIARILPGLPMTWTSAEVGLGGMFPAADHAPVLINANPLNKLRYVVINSGYTFGAREFTGTNALLYPHLGDHAIIKIGEYDDVKVNGYFDEKWKTR
ncbi:alpha/beta hydrolase-fold protein [Tundrisphaera lichenicola]|uniref:alpha/beta hydrolase-fold protein n=1 Tax=Tundrisphaera lichenicola TaxID=2029860 RepID=UPI003EBE7230